MTTNLVLCNAILLISELLTDLVHQKEHYWSLVVGMGWTRRHSMSSCDLLDWERKISESLFLWFWKVRMEKLHSHFNVFIIFGKCDLKLCFLFLCHKNRNFFFSFLPFLPAYSVFVIPFSVYGIPFSVYVNNFQILCYVIAFSVYVNNFQICYFNVTFQEVFSTL